MYRVEPRTGETVARSLGIPFSNPYDCDVDDADRVWIATDNHVVMYDPTSDRFVRYPVPERTDLPKLSITREGAIWFSPRNAGQSGGYGGAASVLYPDKDRITTLAAYYSDKSERNHRARYRGPVTKITGRTIKTTPDTPQNPGEYTAMLKSLGIAPGQTGQEGTTRALKGGAAVE